MPFLESPSRFSAARGPAGLDRTVLPIADDFGFDADTVRATIACFSGSAVTGASLMASMPGTQLALAFARANPQHDFGVHLVLSGNGIEKPVCPPRDVPSLVDRRGSFPSTNVFVIRAITGRIDPVELDRELRAQIGVLLEAGITPAFVNSHGHVHRFRVVFEALRRILPVVVPSLVRRSQSIWIRKPLASPNYWLRGLWHLPIQRAFVTTDHFFNATCATDRQTHSALVERIRNSRGSIEVGVHPGRSDEWRKQEDAMIRSVVRALHETLVPIGRWRDLRGLAEH